jgi:hypothetical protein
MAASAHKHTEILVWLIKHGADAQALHQHGGTAADASRQYGAPTEQTEYLESRTHLRQSRLHRRGAQEVRRLLEGVLL